MSDKPRVYQGVRVKTTVKELLQRHRAREANRKKLKTISQACLELQELCASTFPSRTLDPPSTISPNDTSSCNSRAFQLRTFPVPDSACNIQMHESTFNDNQPQFEDVMLPSNGYGNNSPCIPYNTSLPLPPSSPLPWCHGLSSDADFYGNGMAPCSSSVSPTLCSSMDHNSYSPQDSFSSSSSSCYDSPTRMESSFCGFVSEYYQYQHCNPQDCYCVPRCWPSQQESFTAPEHASYYNTTDYPYACPVEEDYLRRDYPVSSELCYNVL